MDDSRASNRGNQFPHESGIIDDENSDTVAHAIAPRGFARASREKNRGNIPKSGQPTIAKNGSSADQVAGDDFSGQRVDHQLFFTNQVIDDETKAFFGSTETMTKFFRTG